jgi:hypothetical protein
MGSIFGESKQEKEEFNIIERLLSIIENLTRPAQKPPKATALKANYITVDKSGNLIFNNSTTNSMAAQNVNVLGTQNTVPGQLVPVLADGVTPLPISSIQAGSEAYSAVDQATGNPSLIATVAPVSGGSEGQYAVTRIAGQAGVVLISYKALAADGVTIITNAGGTPDVITFQPAGATGPAAALTATYGSPS